MSENMTRLRRALRIERATRGGGARVEPQRGETNAALAAVEQELAALRLSYENASRAHFEATKRIDALTECQAALKEELDEEIDHNARLSAKLDETKHNCACDYDERGAVCLVHTRPVREARERMAALEAERDELRKRPTLEEVLRVVTQWDYDNRHALSTWADTEPEDKTLDARMRALYTGKAAQ